MASPYRHIIWDWNGTLLDDAWLCVEVLNHLLLERDMAPISGETYRENFGFPVIDFYRCLDFDFNEDSFEAISHEFIGNYESRWLKECALHPESRESLRRLANLGVTHSVLSAAKQEALEVGIQHFGIASFFTGLLGTDNIFARGKVEQGRCWIEQLVWRPEEVVMVGDTLHDFEVAQAMGTDCILVSHGHHTPARLANSGAPVVHSLAELVERISSKVDGR